MWCSDIQSLHNSYQASIPTNLQIPNELWFHSWLQSSFHTPDLSVHSWQASGTILSMPLCSLFSLTVDGTTTSLAELSQFWTVSKRLKRTPKSSFFNFSILKTTQFPLLFTFWKRFHGLVTLQNKRMGKNANSDFWQAKLQKRVLSESKLQKSVN